MALSLVGPGVDPGPRRAWQRQTSVIVPGFRYVLLTIQAKAHALLLPDQIKPIGQLVPVS